jgi:hypothetical protein
MAKKLIKHCLVLFQGRTASSRLRTISRSLVHHVQRELDRSIKTPKEKTEIEVWIDSPGGDANAAYKLALDLRHRCSRLTAVIPDLAKSAATLFVMGVDEIYMAHAAELGPLDVQIAHPDRENEVVSGLDVKESLDYLSKFALELILAGGASVMEATDLPRLEVLRSMQNFTARFLEPCVAKLDPHLTRRAVYQLQVAERYAIELLRSRNLSNRVERTTHEDLVAHLVNHYPVHEFVISRTEAKQLGLPITEAERHPHWAEIKELHEGFIRGEDSRVFAMSEEKIFHRPNSSKAGSDNAKQKQKTSSRKNERENEKPAGSNDIGTNGGSPTSITRRVSE